MITNLGTVEKIPLDKYCTLARHLGFTPRSGLNPSMRFYEIIEPSQQDLAQILSSENLPPDTYFRNIWFPTGEYSISESRRRLKKDRTYVQTLLAQQTAHQRLMVQLRDRTTEEDTYLDFRKRSSTSPWETIEFAISPTHAPCFTAEGLTNIWEGSLFLGVTSKPY